MEIERLTAPGWTHLEKHKQRALVVLAIMAAGLIAAGPRNERRLFLLPDVPLAFAAIPAPEPTSLRSAIMGYLDDGCAPDVESSTSGLERAIDSSDCGKGRKRQKKAAPPAPPVAEPAAFLAVPDDPRVLDASPLLVINDLPIDPVALPNIGGGPVTGPFRGASITPVALLGSVPEPASWALMISGLGLAGALLRRRPNTVQPA